MHARVTTITPGAQGAGDQVYRDTIAKFRGLEGNKGVILFAGGSSGKIIGVSLWEDEQAMQASAQQSAQLRKDATTATQGQIESVEEYEVAVWDVD